ncbi:MAG: VWA domain-containing protein [Myxococcales bacterium]|nr:VWA domain-containing protein [Myxococcales bacterium]
MKRIAMMVVAALPALAGMACTDTNIYQISREPNIPNKVTLSGTVCTDDPAQRRFPVKLMFLFDTSGWDGNVNPDPAKRQEAMQYIVDRYRANLNYSLAIIKFGGGTRLLTEGGYTRDYGILNNALGELVNFDPQVDACVGGGCRDWFAALSLASSVFSGDLLTTNPGTRSRTRYVFIFIAHGPPDPGYGSLAANRAAVLAALDEIEKFGKEKGVAEVAFHTIQIDNPTGTCQGTPQPRNCNSTTPCPANCSGGETCNDAVRLCADDHTLTCTLATDCCADPQNCSTRCAPIRVCSNDVSRECTRREDCCPTYPCDDPNGAQNDQVAQLLQALAFQGHGDYVRFFDEGKLNFTTLKFDTTESVFVMKTFMVTNLNTHSINGRLLADSDTDGMSDAEERCYGEMLAGTCRDLWNCSCVEDFFNKGLMSGSDTDPANADSDGDMLGDRLEVVFATLNLDPLRFDLPQACYGLDFPYSDRDGDGLNDCEEKILGTDTGLFDSDRDGYPDRIEFNAGTNYLKPDQLLDSDMDGLSNGQEIREHLDPLSNDITSRAGDAYRYKVVDEGLRIVPFSAQPVTITGVEITDVSGRSAEGAGMLYFYPPGTLRPDGQPRPLPTLAWKDPMDSQPGPEIEITGSGIYQLFSACSCVKDCNPACSVGNWCDPNTGACVPDPCALVTCKAGEVCDSSQGLCIPDCRAMECADGQRCDLMLGKCLTDRCINVRCLSGQECDPESGVCTPPPCQSWSCPAGSRVNEHQKPTWITVKVDANLTPLDGFWCDGAQPVTLCASDGDCPAGKPCRMGETIVVGMADKNCITFKVKNITLVETLETIPGMGPGRNDLWLYFAETPLNNPTAYSIFRRALYQMKFANGKKEPNVAEIPLGDGDFFAVDEK